MLPIIEMSVRGDVFVDTPPPPALGVNQIKVVLCQPPSLHIHDRIERKWKMDHGP